MTGYAVQALLPLAPLGRLTLPRTRLRYRDGWVRIGRAPRMVVCTLEDREGHLLPAATFLEATAQAVRMGRAVAFHLQRHNRYERQDETGDPQRVQVAVA